MKLLISSFFVLLALTAFTQQKDQTENIFIITTDGLRWQEIFTGADSLLINNTSYNRDTVLQNCNIGILM